jgi:hypothetical protein
MKPRKRKFSGRGMHECYLSSSSNTTKIRKRENCQHYNRETKWCEMIFNQCVGPVICKHYSEKSCKESLIGTVINNKYYGKGVIVSESDTFCTIQYENLKLQCSKRNLSELSKANSETTEKVSQ